MKEFLSEVLGSIKVRAKNPLCGAFVISWVVFNWKEISVYCFSSKGIEKIIAYIDPPCEGGNLLWGLAPPFLSAIAIVLFFPFISLIVSLIRVRIQKYQDKTDSNRLANKEKCMFAFYLAKEKNNPNGEWVRKKLEADFELEKKSQELELINEQQKQEAELARIEEVKVQIQKEKVELKLAKQKEKANRKLEYSMPLKYYEFVYKLQKSMSILLEGEDIHVTLEQLENLVAYSVGCSSFAELFEINKNKLRKKIDCNYILFDAAYSSRDLSLVPSGCAEREYILEEAFEYDLTVITSFDDFIIELGERILLDKNIMMDEGLSEAITESNGTDYSNPHNLELESAGWTDSGLEARLVGISSDGYLDRDSSVQTLPIKVTMSFVFPSVLGKYGLGEYQVEYDGAVDYGEDE